MQPQTFVNNTYTTWVQIPAPAPISRLTANEEKPKTLEEFQESSLYYYGTNHRIYSLDN